MVRRTLLCVVLSFEVQNTAHATVCEDGFAYSSAESQSPIGQFVASVRRAKGKPDYNHLRLSVVIPVFMELQNGNLRKLLTSFSDQTIDDLPTELVFVVNNSKKIAQKKNTKWHENQDTLRYLIAFQSGEGLSDDDRVLYSKLSKSSVTLTILDYSTTGVARNIGRIRQLGVDAVLNRHLDELENVIVSTFDADSIPPREYFEDIAWHFSDGANDAAAFFMHFKVPQGSSPELHASHHTMRVPYRVFDLTFAYNGSAPPGGSPRIVVRGSLLHSIGGFRSLGTSEDTDLLKRLNQRVILKPLWLHPVETADRARKESYDGASRVSTLTMQEEDTHFRLRQIELSLHTLIKNFMYLMKLPQSEILLAEFIYWKIRAIDEYTAIQRRLNDSLPEPKAATFQRGGWESISIAQFWNHSIKDDVRDSSFWSATTKPVRIDLALGNMSPYLHLNALESKDENISLVMYYEAIATAMSRFAALKGETDPIYSANPIDHAKSQMHYSSQRLTDDLVMLYSLSKRTDCNWLARVDLFQHIIAAYGGSLYSGDAVLGEITRLLDLETSKGSKKQFLKFLGRLMDELEKRVKAVCQSESETAADLRALTNITRVRAYILAIEFMEVSPEEFDSFQRTLFP